MAKQTASFQENIFKLSRIIVMLFNRATMYHMNHPYVKQSLEEFYPAIIQVFANVSPVVFILHRDQFFLDEEPIDSRNNVQRIVSHFKKAGLQSISFENGLSENEIKAFLEIFTSLEAYPDVEAMNKAMVVKGVRHMKLNHVFFRKVSQDDEVISHKALKKLVPDVSLEDQERSKKAFVDLVLKNLLAEELKETLTIENLLKNPAALSQTMAEKDFTGAGDTGEEGNQPGVVLLHQLEILGDEVNRNLLSSDGVNLHDVAAALTEMKGRLLESIETQKSLEITFSTEEMIFDKVNEISDSVIQRIVKDEYHGGKTSLERLAQILRRLAPDPMELKRLLPSIRVALMEEGMLLGDYLHLVQELSKELQSDELARILQQSSEELGIDGQALIEELKRSPTHAAELIFLASEIRKGSGDERALADLLVDYVERIGSDSALTDANADQADAEQRFRQIITAIGSRVVGRLKQMNVKNDLLERIEQKFDTRMDEILEKVKLDWIQSHSCQEEKQQSKERSVLELLEHSVAEGDELGEILASVRAKVQANEMDENDFGQIYAEISRQQQLRAEERTGGMPGGFLHASTLTLVIEKEIAMAKRYEMPFSAISFSLVKAVQKSAGPPAKISPSSCMTAVLKAISATAREADILGELGKNRIVLLLPMTGGSQAQSALRRYLKLLSTNVMNVDGVLLNFRVAGVAATYSPTLTPDAAAFIRNLMNDLVQMERRIKNLQVYF